MILCAILAAEDQGFDNNWLVGRSGEASQARGGWLLGNSVIGSLLPARAGLDDQESVLDGREGKLEPLDAEVERAQGASAAASPLATLHLARRSRAMPLAPGCSAT